MNDQTPLLTPEQAAQALNLPTSRLARWRSKGVGPSYLKLEGRVLYEMDSLLVFLDGSQVRMAPHRPRWKKADRKAKAKSAGRRAAFAEADRRYFEGNPDARYRVRRWTSEDALCGTSAFDGRDLTEAMVVVFRSGHRIPAPFLLGDPEGAALADFLSWFASGVLTILSEGGEDLPPQA